MFPVPSMPVTAAIAIRRGAEANARSAPVRAINSPASPSVWRRPILAASWAPSTPVTATLRMLSGLLHPTSGNAIVAGGSPGSPTSLARMGAMVETPAFYPYLSGRDNLRVVARYAGAPKARIEPALEQVDLKDRARFK